MMTAKHITRGNVFADLGFDTSEAINLKVRADLMIALRSYIEKNHLTQIKAAKLFGVDQPQMSRLLQGKIQNFTVDKLLIMLSRAGIRVSLKITAPRVSKIALQKHM